MQKLNNNTLALQALLTKVNNLPEGGGSGGGGASVETCTVTISFTFGDPTHVWISGTQLVDGNISSFTFIDYGNGTQSFTSPLTISNIVKNTPLTISGYGSYDFASNVGTFTGCELAYAAIAAKTFAVKVTDTIASVVVRNDY